MRIGINTLFLVPGDVGGTEVYLRETLAAMAEQVGGDRLVLFTNRENDQLLRADLAVFPQIEFHQLPCRAAVRPLRILAEQLLLPFTARKAQVDVLWSPGYTAPAICCSPQAVTIHDLQYKTHPEDMGWLELTALDILVRTACRRCQAVIAISKFSRQEIIRHRFAPAEKIYAVLNGVKKDFALPLSADEADRVLCRQGVRKPFLLCVAHTYPHKNVDKLVEAFALLEEKIPHQLVLVGKGRRGEEAVRTSLLKIKNLGRVIRLQRLTGLELRTLYQAADIFVLPSSYEGFGLPVLEALAAGLPVVTVRKASLPEVGGNAACYAEIPEPLLLAGKILEIVRHSTQERSSWTDKGREWAKQFTWEQTAAQTLRVLRALQNN